MCVVFRHVANNTQCLRRVGRECWILWGWSYRWVWGAGTWAVVLCQSSVCSSLLSHTLALHLLFFFLPNVFNFFFYVSVKANPFCSTSRHFVKSMFKIISQSRWLLFSVEDWPQVPVSWSKEPSCPHMGYKRESWQEKMRLLLGQGLLDWFCFWFPLPLGGSELTEGRQEGRFALIPNWLTNYDQQPVQQTAASPRIELSHNQIFCLWEGRWNGLWLVSSMPGPLPLQALWSSLS